MEMKKADKRRVLVTGATGLLGSHLTKALLDRGDEVVALIQDMHPDSVFAQEQFDTKVIMMQGNLEDFATLERAIGIYGIDTVFHLGAQTLVTEGVRSPLSTFETNIRGTYNLLEACRLHGALVKRIVCASSDKAYGTSPKLPYTEDMPLRGQHPYDVSKSCMDLISQAYAHTYKMPICVLRCGNIYGPGDTNWSRLIPATIRSVVRGESPIIRSDGTYVRDYLFVEDIVDGYLRIADAMDKNDVRGQTFNLGPNAPINVMDVVTMILSLMDAKGVKCKILNEAKNEIHDQYLSGEKMKRTVQWEAKHTLQEGLKKTIPWYVELCKKQR